MKPIFLTLATDRGDKGKTDNYTVYGGGPIVTVKNRNGEDIQKPGLVGSNGTIYVAHSLAEDAQGMVLMSREYWDRYIVPQAKMNIKLPAPSPNSRIGKGKKR